MRETKIQKLNSRILLYFDAFEVEGNPAGQLSVIMGIVVVMVMIMVMVVVILVVMVVLMVMGNLRDQFFNFDNLLII